MYFGAITLGFYYGEVAHITNSQVFGLDKFRIPCIIIMIIVWVMDFICSVMLMVRVESLSILNLITIFCVAHALAITAACVILIWGIISLGRSMMDSSMKGPLIRLVGLSVLIICAMLGFGIPYCK